MMLDDLHSRDGQPAASRATTSDVRRVPAEREVPIGPPALTLSDAVHAWLDGDATEASARRDQTHGDVDFWKRLDGDLAQRRGQRPRAGFAARVMAAIRADDDER
jgi:hypothetical protein